MKLSLKKISIGVAILLGTTTFCAAQDDETSRMVLKSITEALLENDCDKAQRNYNIWKDLTGKTNADIEDEIKDCKTSGGKAGYIELQIANIAVQTTDIGNQVSYETARLMCKNSIIGGFKDWRLPDENELMILFTEKNRIQNFVDDLYWVGDRNEIPLPRVIHSYTKTINGRKYKVYPIEDGYVYSENQMEPTVYNAKKTSDFPPYDKSTLKTNTTYYYLSYAIFEGGEINYYGTTKSYTTPAVKVINFNNGNITSLDDNTQKNAKHNCRCVRSLPKPAISNKTTKE
jgi:hypothetical protein